jgi:hypothetical protein
MPRATRCSHLALRFATPHSSRPDSCCAQSRSDLYVVASSSVSASSYASTSIHCGAASRWVHVATVCFMRFRCMLHIFHLNVAKVDLVLHMFQWLYTYVASVCFKCFSCFKRMLQVFYLDIAYGALAIYLCCKCMFKCFSCFKRMLQVFYLDVAYVAMLIHICCKRML